MMVRLSSLFALVALLSTHAIDARMMCPKCALQADYNQAALQFHLVARTYLRNQLKNEEKGNMNKYFRANVNKVFHSSDAVSTGDIIVKVNSCIYEEITPRTGYLFLGQIVYENVPGYIGKLPVFELGLCMSQKPWKALAREDRKKLFNLANQPKVCEFQDCKGPIPDVAVMKCADGSVSGGVVSCGYNAKANACAWNVTSPNCDHVVIDVVVLDPPIMMIGRPFFDANGASIEASVEQQSPLDSHIWSATDTSRAQQELQASSTADLVSEWTSRASGEHASIASFAAFTISLMANQAPPDLIRDSLLAAMDELNHATTSFEVLSLLTGVPTAPGALPESEHRFRKDLTSLALATALEGCIGETLSALEMAAQVEASASRNDKDKLTALLADKTRIIAIEESKHSALAWRTIQWVCSTDADACKTVLERELSAANIESATKKRFAGSELSQWELSSINNAWTDLYTTLLPAMTTELLGEPEVCFMVDDAEGLEDSDGFVAYVVANILKHTICNGQDKLKPFPATVATNATRPFTNSFVGGVPFVGQVESMMV